jgi:hypothetical protein
LEEVIKNKLYNFALPEKIELKPRNWLFIPLGKPKFDITFVSCGRLQMLTGITNEILSQLPITGLVVTKCPRGTTIKKANEEG